MLSALFQNDPALTDADRAALQVAFRKKTYPKGGFLLREGTVATDVFFIAEGVVRQYFALDSGNAHACTFTLPGAFVTNIESFIQHTPSVTAINALTDTVCYSISCETLTGLMTASPAISAYFQREVEKVAVENAARVRQLLSQSAEEKYLDILRNTPEWIAQIPQQYLAQYIGVAPESLSRIRRKIAGK